MGLETNGRIRVNSTWNCVGLFAKVRSQGTWERADSGEIKVLLGEAHVCNSCKISTWKWAFGIQKISMWDLLTESELDELTWWGGTKTDYRGRRPRRVPSEHCHFMWVQLSLKRYVQENHVHRVHIHLFKILFHELIQPPSSKGCTFSLKRK